MQTCLQRLHNFQSLMDTILIALIFLHYFYSYFYMDSIILVSIFVYGQILVFIFIYGQYYTCICIFIWTVFYLYSYSTSNLDLESNTSRVTWVFDLYSWVSFIFVSSLLPLMINYRICLLVFAALAMLCKVWIWIA